ncbi:MAG TPA: sigma-70 family RNA polymerase sigma factor [Candidatus Bipolaricaulota bacterium]|nr:sigma-70 family RNA polymerase sigma factor [Candidatus Bipolaricaulota bacterium]
MEETEFKTGLENEADLVERAKTDDGAFGVLYGYYFPKIYGYIFKRVGNRETAEDLVSEIFMKVFCNLERYSARGFGFSTWLYRVATNHLTDFYRKAANRKIVDIDQVAEPADKMQGIEDKIQVDQDRGKIQSIIAKLKPNYQKVLNLKYFAELSTFEIADIFKITENNARVLLHRAHKSFKNLYEKHGK